MTVLAWITEESWAACVDAVRTLAPPDEDVALLYVTDSAALDAAHSAFTGLLGRSGTDPSRQWRHWPGRRHRRSWRRPRHGWDGLASSCTEPAAQSMR